MGDLRIGRLTVTWRRSPRSLLNIPRAFRGPEPRAQLHLHDWSYRRSIEPPPFIFRVCRACGAREASDVEQPTRQDWHRHVAAVTDR